MTETMADLSARIQRCNRRCPPEGPDLTLEHVLDMLDLHLQSSDTYSVVAGNLLTYFTEGRFPEQLVYPCQELLAQHMPSGRESISAIENVINASEVNRRHLSALREDLTATITAHFQQPSPAKCS